MQDVTATRNAGLVALFMGAGIAGYVTASAHADPSEGLERPALQQRVADATGLPPGGPDRSSPGAEGPSGRLPPRPPLHGLPPFPPPLALATMLNAQETAIGIRSDQLDVWRDYADAVQALMALPPPPKDEPAARTDAFARPAEMAARVQASGKKAAAVLAALDKLKAKLTAEQLDRAKVFEAQLPPPPPFPPAAPGLPPLRLPPPGVPG